MLTKYYSRNEPMLSPLSRQNILRLKIREKKIDKKEATAGFGILYSTIVGLM